MSTVARATRDVADYHACWLMPGSRTAARSGAQRRPVRIRARVPSCPRCWRVSRCSLAAWLVSFGYTLPALAQTAASAAPQPPASAVPGRCSAEQSPAHCPAPALSRVLLIGTARPLESALRTALSPWGFAVGRLESQPVELELQGVASRAPVLAHELGAAALIWLSTSSREGTSLWLYDATRGTTSARQVPSGSLNARLSAALALSIKTALRSASAAAGADATRAQTERTAAAATPDSSQGSAVSPIDSATRPSSADSRAAELRLALSAALRRGALSQGRTETRYAAELRWAPWARPIWPATDPWFSARFDLGEELPIAGPSFTGRYSQIQAGLGFGVSRRWGSFVDVGAQLGACLDRASLSGTLLSDATPATRVRFGATLFLRPELAFSVGPLALLLQPGMTAALGRQLYVADGQAVLETGHFSWLLGAGLRLNVL